MNKFLCAPVVVALLASCASSYNVRGTSSVAALDGSKLYLKALKAGSVKNLDSCEVVHGEFHFAGLLDSVRVANLYMDDESILPVVLEEGDIQVSIGPAGPTVGGTPLNDSLYKFIDRHTQLVNQMSELGHRQNQMILDGIDEQTIGEQLEGEAARISAEEDQLVTKFIEQNFDNVLGPGVFMMITSQFRFPVLTPQIEYIMSKATQKFKDDAYVKSYMEAAHENEMLMNGLSDPVQQQPADTASSVPPVAPVPPVPPVAPLTNVPHDPNR